MLSGAGPCRDSNVRDVSPLAAGPPADGRERPRDIRQASQHSSRKNNSGSPRLRHRPIRPPSGEPRPQSDSRPPSGEPRPQNDFDTQATNGQIVVASSSQQVPNSYEKRLRALEERTGALNVISKNIAEQLSLHHEFLVEKDSSSLQSQWALHKKVTLEKDMEVLQGQVSGVQQYCEVRFKSLEQQLCHRRNASLELSTTIECPSPPLSSRTGPLLSSCTVCPPGIEAVEARLKDVEEKLDVYKQVAVDRSGSDIEVLRSQVSGVQQYCKTRLQTMEEQVSRSDILSGQNSLVAAVQNLESHMENVKVHCEKRFATLEAQTSFYSIASPHGDATAADHVASSLHEARFKAIEAVIEENISALDISWVEPKVSQIDKTLEELQMQLAGLALRVGELHHRACVNGQLPSASGSSGNFDERDFMFNALTTQYQQLQEQVSQSATNRQELQHQNTSSPAVEDQAPMVSDKFRVDELDTRLASLVTRCQQLQQQVTHTVVVADGEDEEVDAEMLSTTTNGLCENPQNSSHVADLHDGRVDWMLSRLTELEAKHSDLDTQMHTRLRSLWNHNDSVASHIERCEVQMERIHKFALTEIGNLQEFATQEIGNIQDCLGNVVGTTPISVTIQHVAGFRSCYQHLFCIGEILDKQDQGSLFATTSACSTSALDAVWNERHELIDFCFYDLLRFRLHDCFLHDRGLAPPADTLLGEATISGKDIFTEAFNGVVKLTSGSIPGLELHVRIARLGLSFQHTELRSIASDCNDLRIMVEKLPSFVTSGSEVLESLKADIDKGAEFRENQAKSDDQVRAKLTVLELATSELMGKMQHLEKVPTNRVLFTS